MAEAQQSPPEITCRRCAKSGAPPLKHRIPFKALRPMLLESLCAACWSEWEQTEVRIVNEYRLNFLVPEHRAALERACREFLALPEGDEAQPS
jgi:Fe-S cluster biosynthesis and repair protein YggX